MVARESGTISGVLPISVTGQTGREAKVIYWVNEAWNQIQNDKDTWRWMRGEFDGAISASSQRYTGAGSFSLTRWAGWITDNDTMTIYPTADGVAYETPIGPIPFANYRAMYERGTRTAGAPVVYSVSDANELCFQLPDTAYTVRGMYRKTPQDLTANADIPEMPVRFHNLIAWDALILLAGADESISHMQIFQQRATRLRGDLMRDQLPQISIGGPLA